MAMTLVDVILMVVVIIMIYSLIFTDKVEHWKPCSNCDYVGIPRNGMVQINPMNWPYSAFANPDSIYLPPGTKSAPKRTAPLTHLETPDHLVLTN